MGFDWCWAVAEGEEGKDRSRMAPTLVPWMDGWMDGWMDQSLLSKDPGLGMVLRMVLGMV